MSPGVSGIPYLLNQNSIDLWLEFLLACELSATLSIGDNSYSRFIRRSMNIKLLNISIITMHLDAEHGSGHDPLRSEEHTSELQSPVPISYAVFCLKKKKITNTFHEYFHYLSIKYST